MGISIALHDENKAFINAAFKGFSVEEFTKKRMIYYLKFQLDTVVDSTLESSLKDTLEKVERMTDLDWRLLVLKLPFQIMSYDDNEPEE